MVERVARALCAYHFDLSGNDDEKEAQVIERRWPLFVPQARAAIEAMRTVDQQALGAAWRSLSAGKKAAGIARLGPGPGFVDALHAYLDAALALPIPGDENTEGEKR